MIFSQVHPIQLKVKLILTTAIALDRDIVSTILHLSTILYVFFNQHDYDYKMSIKILDV